LRAAYAQRLCEPDVLTDYGLRTLSSEHPQFAPDAYHRGAVWPFDSWLGWGGLRAAGREAEAERVRRGVLAAGVDDRREVRARAALRRATLG
jgi:glycogen debranching enzyme